MRIGVNALYLIPGGVGGTEIYLRNLLQAFAGIDRQNEYFVFTNRETGGDLVPEGFHHEPQSVNAVSRPRRLLYEQTSLRAELKRRRVDVLLNPGFTAPFSPGCPNVTVFHDLQHLRHPEHFRWFDLPFWRMFLWGSVRRSTLILADSEATGADLRRYYHLPETRVRVVPLGVEPHFFEIARMRAPEQFLLCVSTLHPHKNLDRLVSVFAKFRERRPDWKLVIAGLRGFFAEQLEAGIARLGIGDCVHLTGWIPREELYDLYRRAGAFVYPSTFEGFGLPVLEAMAAGVPLACSDIEPLSAIVGDGAVKFPPGDEDAMLQSLLAVTQPNEHLVQRGSVRAREFTWEKTARKTLEALVEAAHCR